MPSPCRRLSLLGLIGLLLATAPAAAAPYDMSGKWGVHPSSGSFQQYWDVVQSAGTLQMTWSNLPPGAVLYGTIDEMTGAFSVTMPQLYPGCGTNTLEGTVAADGRSFAATQIIWTFRCGPVTSFCPGCQQTTTGLVGSHCGNGLLEPGEVCDDGNGVDGDCCSSSCTIDPAGTACSSDNNVCTDDVCDGTLTCTHVNNTIPCGADECGVKSCVSGSCVVTASEPAGTSCDLDASVCTPDTCDGAGACQAGAAVTCAPCEMCSATAGCVADTGATCDPASPFGKIDVKLDPGDGKRLKLQIADYISYEDMGEPRLDTSYRLCLYQRDGIGPDQVIVDAAIPPGGTCKEKPCWRLQNYGFKYRDAVHGADGITAVDVVANGKGITMQGKGANLPFPSSFPATPITIASKVIADQGGVQKCWYHVIPPHTQQPNRFKGRYRQ